MAEVHGMAMAKGRIWKWQQDDVGEFALYEMDVAGDAVINKGWRSGLVMRDRKVGLRWRKKVGNDAVESHPGWSPPRNFVISLGITT